MDQLISTILLSGNGIGFAGLASLIVVGYMRGWIVPRKTLQDMVDDRDSWKEMALALKDDNSRLLVVGEMSASSMRALEKMADAKNGGEGT